jgi:hypothetical protein
MNMSFLGRNKKNTFFPLGGISKNRLVASTFNSMYTDFRVEKEKGLEEKYKITRFFLSKKNKSVSSDVFTWLTQLQNCR